MQADEQRRDHRQGHHHAEQEGDHAERDDAAVGADEAERGDDQQRRGSNHRRAGSARSVVADRMGSQRRRGWAAAPRRRAAGGRRRAPPRVPRRPPPGPGRALGINDGAARSPGAMLAWKIAPSSEAAEDADRDAGERRPRRPRRRRGGRPVATMRPAARRRPISRRRSKAARAALLAVTPAPTMRLSTVTSRSSGSRSCSGCRRSGTRVVGRDARAELRVDLARTPPRLSRPARSAAPPAGCAARARTCRSSPRRR